MNNKNKKIVYIAVIVIILVGLFLWLKPAKAPTETSQINDTATAPVAPQTRVFELAVQNGKIVSGPNVLTVGQGDRLTIKVIADVSDEFHIHGYDISTDLVKEKQGGVIFTANMTGRFPFELENAKAELGTLEVLPR